MAREAGVSTATVSHVINGTKYVTDDTRRRVLEAIERCEYHPNAHARSLASGRSNMLGLLISDISNPFFPELVKSIETAAFERGYDVVLSKTTETWRRVISRNSSESSSEVSSATPAIYSSPRRRTYSAARAGS